MVKKVSGVCLDLQMYLQYGETKVAKSRIFSELEHKFKATSWLPNDALQTIQAQHNVYKFLCMEDLTHGNGEMLHLTVDDVGRYGKNFPVFYPSLQDQLSYFRNIKQKKAMDIGSALGMTLWKELLNGFNVTAVDPVYKKQRPLEMMRTYVKVRAPEKFASNLQILDDELFDLPSKYPELKGSYDFINVQNVFHFYSPKSVDEMLKIMFSLLKDGGRAVITAEMINSACNYETIVECPSKIARFKEIQDAPYVVKYQQEPGEVVTMKLLQDYSEEEVSFFHQDRDRGTLECAKVYYDLESLTNLCKANAFKVVELYGYQYMAMSLVVEKLGDIATTEGEL